MHRIAIDLPRSPTVVQLRAGGADSPASGHTKDALDPIAEEAARREQQFQTLQQQNQQLGRLLQAVQFEVDEVENRRQQSLRELQQIAVELAVMVASHVVDREIDGQTHNVRALVEKAVEKLQLNDPAIVRLNPADLDLLQNQLQQQPSPWNSELIQLRADTSIERGAVRLDADSGRILLSDVATRITEVRRLWMENLDDTYVERREVSENAQQMRRFPDRRETA